MLLMNKKVVLYITIKKTKNQAKNQPTVITRQIESTNGFATLV